MPILVMGLALWALLAILAWRVLWPLFHTALSAEASWLRWAIPLTVVAIGFVFCRPHEDMFGGQDQGSYLNSAFTYARRQALTYVDEMLAKVPPESRPIFYSYGGNVRSASTPIRDVLRVAEHNGAVMAPWFQPEYSIILGAVVSLAPDRWVFYVTPLLALLAILMIAALARELFDGAETFWTAAVIAGLTGLVVWHARCVRAEWPATVCAYGGATLLFRQVRTGLVPIGDALLGAVGLATAPFFHSIAWVVVVPMGVLAGAAAFLRRPALLLYPFVLLLGVLGYAWHTCHVTDCYSIAQLCRPILRVAPWIALAGVSATTWAWVLVSRDRQRGKLQTLARFLRRTAECRWMRILVAVGISLAVVARSATGSAYRESGISALSVLSITNFRNLAILLSVSVALLSLAGWSFWVLTGRDRRGARLAAALVLVPGLFVASDFPEYMFGSRYFLIGAMPVVALSLTALVVWVARRAKRGWAIPVAVLIIVAAGACGRTHLFTTVDYRGLQEFLASVADAVKARNAVVLFEYSRLAAPMDHFFGVPTLGVDNENTTDYTRVEEAWAGIMRDDPRRMHVLVTPFADPPVSERFTFERLEAWSYAGRRLRQERGALPRKIEDWKCSLSIYRMNTREVPAVTVPSAPKSYTFAMDAGNFGKCRFGRRKIVERQVEGFLVREGDPLVLHAGENRAPRERFLFVYDEAESGVPPALTSSTAADHCRGTWTSPTRGWWVVDLRGTVLSASACTVRLDRVAVLNGVFDTDAMPIAPDTCAPESPRVQRRVRMGVRGAVSGADASLLVCVSPSTPTFVCLLGAASATQGRGVLRMREIRKETAGSPAVLPDHWQWQVWRIRQGMAEGVLRLTPQIESEDENRRNGREGEAKVLLAAGAVIADIPR